MQKIRKGDEVIVIAGRSKGQRGNVLRQLEDGRLLVENVNMVKKHVKANPRSGESGGIVDQEAPIVLLAAKRQVAAWRVVAERALPIDAEHEGLAQAIGNASARHHPGTL